SASSPLAKNSSHSSAASRNSSETSLGPLGHGPALVLVVDDHERNLQQVKKVLTFDGYHVMTAESGEEALRCLSVRKPDLILLDVLMPGMDGFQVCEEIKNKPGMQDIPIMFLSNDTEHQSLMTGFAKGGVDYIRKPFNKAELLARVRTHVELRRSQCRHEKQIQEKQRTLDLIAHEWHKPLQKIGLILSKLKELGGTSSKGTVMSALGTEAMRETERMLSSIETYLHHETTDPATHATPPPSRLTSDDLKSMAGKWYVTAKRKLIDLQLSAPAKPVAVVGPPFAVNQIVDAMLSNAVNFTPQNGRIDVQIVHEEEKVSLKVQDDGPGFSTEYLRRKFQPFLRAVDTTPAKASSLGVGLAAAKRIADRIQASLTVSNRSGGGACVTVTFAKG
ncbi:MAG TPA: response regulator, partial [Prosthecobacter sp.]|nr:response regulator [Prosthecobacter sp.]